MSLSRPCSDPIVKLERPDQPDVVALLGATGRATWAACIRPRPTTSWTCRRCSILRDRPSTGRATLKAGVGRGLPPHGAIPPPAPALRRGQAHVRGARAARPPQWRAVLAAPGRRLRDQGLTPGPAGNRRRADWRPCACTNAVAIHAAATPLAPIGQRPVGLLRPRRCETSPTTTSRCSGMRATPWPCSAHGDGRSAGATCRREVHPDRFRRRQAPPRSVVAMQWAVRVNEAYQRLKDPLTRAAYLCELRGMPVDAERNTAMPGAFLMQQMQLARGTRRCADAWLTSSASMAKSALGKEKPHVWPTAARKLDDRQRHGRCRRGARARADVRAAVSAKTVHITPRRPGPHSLTPWPCCRSPNPVRRPTRTSDASPWASTWAPRIRWWLPCATAWPNACPTAQGRVLLPSVVRYLEGGRRQIGDDAARERRPRTPRTRWSRSSDSWAAGWPTWPAMRPAAVPLRRPARHGGHRHARGREDAGRGVGRDPGHAAPARRGHLRPTNCSAP